MSAVSDHMQTAIDQVEIADRLSCTHSDQVLVTCTGAIVHAVLAVAEATRTQVVHGDFAATEFKEALERQRR